MIKESPIQLQKPGAGLPLLDRLFCKYVLFPWKLYSLSQDQAIKFCVSRGQDIIDIAKSMDKEDLTKQVLVPKIRGLEDSSRFWSVAMTIEHLVMVHKAFVYLIETLSKGGTIDIEIDVASVKPKGEVEPHELIEEYQKLLNVYEKQMQGLSDLKNKAHTKEHPWFGPLTAHQWLCINGAHTHLHKHQILKIKEGL